jgi:hypothetical protein
MHWTWWLIWDATIAELYVRSPGTDPAQLVLLDVEQFLHRRHLRLVPQPLFATVHHSRHAVQSKLLLQDCKLRPLATLTPLWWGASHSIIAIGRRSTVCTVCSRVVCLIFNFVFFICRPLHDVIVVAVIAVISIDGARRKRYRAGPGRGSPEPARATARGAVVLGMLRRRRNQLWVGCLRSPSISVNLG